MPTIRLSTGQEFACVSPVMTRQRFGNVTREALEIRIPKWAVYTELVEAFTDGTGIAIIESVQQIDPETGTAVLNEQGAPLDQEMEYDYSEFCVGGNITDHRDGSFTVLMGKKTDAELLEEENAALLLALAGGMSNV